MALVGDAISHSVLAGIAVVVVAPFIFKKVLLIFSPERRSYSLAR